MSERPILFSGPMVRAILAGTKTQTRRIVTPAPEWRPAHGFTSAGWAWSEPIRDGAKFNAWREPDEFAHALVPHCPYGRPRDETIGRSGDRLWVRETFRQGDGSMSVHYRADEDEVSGGPWRPSIFMPRWASRLTLEVTEVRVQRLQEITEEDARAEGVEADTFDHSAHRCSSLGCPGPGYRSAFGAVWVQINGKRAPWASNPWVWAITFERLPVSR